MPANRNTDTRQALLEAAADLIAATPGQDVPLRAICDRAGVKMPTLYHFFGSKKGLLDAVIEHGFALYLSAKLDHESVGDPIQDLRDGWDAHVAFGLANPGFYALMYGQISPGTRPAAMTAPSAILLELTTSAAAQHRLAVTPEQAADHVLATNIGTTLALITSPAHDQSLSAAIRDATIAAITGVEMPPDETAANDAARLLNRLSGTQTSLDAPENALLRKWLTILVQEDNR